MSELCLGAMTFGESWGWGASEAESARILETYAEAGGNFFDTANVYTDGQSEQIVGKLLAADRRARSVGVTAVTTASGARSSGKEPGGPSGGAGIRRQISFGDGHGLICESGGRRNHPAPDRESPPRGR